MLTHAIAELLATQREVTAPDVARYAGCAPLEATRCLHYMQTIGSLARVRRGVYTSAGVPLRTQSRVDELLPLLPATSAVLGYELGLSVHAIHNLVSRANALGVPVVRDERGVYDVV